MTHEDVNNLLLDLIDSFNHIKKMQCLLQIALEQLDSPSKDFNSRIEVLVSFYLTDASCYLEDIESYLKKLKKLCQKIDNFG